MKYVGARHRYVVNVITDCGCNCGADTSSAREEDATI